MAAGGRGRGLRHGDRERLRPRRYHGLLVVARDVPGRRMLGLASLDVVLRLPGGAVGLSTHEWQDGAVAPDGHRHLVEVEVEVEALCTWRDVHCERSAADGALAVEHLPDGAVVEGSYRLRGPGWRAGGVWWTGVHHREERVRGLTPVEDLWRAGCFSSRLLPGDSLDVQAWAGRVVPPPGDGIVVGPLVDVAVRSGRPEPTVLDGLLAALPEGGMGSVAETADGDAPHAATGCPVQAWSIAELLRARRLLVREG